MSSFVGPAYTTRSKNFSNDSLFNAYVESRQAPPGPKEFFILGSPGLRTTGSVDALSCRGSYTINNRTFRCVAANIYEVTVIGGQLSNGTVETLIGGINDDGRPVSWSSNGRGGEQIAICGGGQLKIFDTVTNLLSGPVVLPMTNPPVMVDFLNGYFLLLEADSPTIWFSALEDGTSWDALDFFTRSTTADNLVGMKVFRHLVWRLGLATTDVAYDSGDADNPFQPYLDSVMQVGCQRNAWPTIQIQGNSLIWLAQNAEGNASVVRASGYDPQDIGTPALSFALEHATTLGDAEAFTYQLDNHQFYVLTVPSVRDAGETWMFDALETGRLSAPIWSQLDNWDEDLGLSKRWRGRGFVAAFGGLLIGDFENGNLYELDVNTFADDGHIQRFSRRAPYLSGEAQWGFLDQVELGAQTGIGLVSGQGSAPVAMLRVSRDSGNTFDAWVDGDLGAIGEYDAMCRFYQLGRARLDRLVIEVAVTDPVRRAFGPGLWLRVSNGSGML